MPPPINYPDINGIRYDFSSIEFGVSPIFAPIVGIQAINYEDTLDPGEIRGTSPQVIGRTRGKYDAKADIVCYVAERELIFAAVAALATTSLIGYREQPFDITVSYSDYLQPNIVDNIVGNRIKKPSSAHKTGQEGLMTKIELHTMYILWNGRNPYLKFLT